MPLYSSSPWQEAGGGGGGMTDELEAVQAQIASLHRSTSGGGRGAVAEESRRSCRAPADAPALCAGGNSILADLGQTHTAGTTGSLLHRETNAIMVHHGGVLHHRLHALHASLCQAFPPAPRPRDATRARHDHDTRGRARPRTPLAPGYCNDLLASPRSWAQLGPAAGMPRPVVPAINW